MPRTQSMRRPNSVKKTLDFNDEVELEKRPESKPIHSRSHSIQNQQENAAEDQQKHMINSFKRKKNSNESKEKP